MKLLDIINGPWAITPSAYEEIRAIYMTHMRGEKIDIAGIEKRLGRELNNENKSYEIENGVAILRVDGIIAKKMNMLSQVSGGVSTDLLTHDFKEALDDPAVSSILLFVDSPGGSVDGLFELTNLIFESRGKKPITAYTDGNMMSAAYAIASAADNILISGPTVQVGSIGVVTSHKDISAEQEKAGIKTTMIAAGKYKTVANPHEPLSDMSRGVIQEHLDYIYSIFVGDVAKFRGVSVDKVLNDMADGRTFIGKQAITAGLVDGVSTFDRLISELSAGDADSNFFAQSAGEPDRTANTLKETQTMNDKGEKTSAIDFAVLTAGSLQAGAPDLVKKIEAAAYAQGCADELARVKGVFAQSTPGHTDLIEKMMFDGESTSGQAAEQVLAADKAGRETALKSMAADAPPPQPQPSTDAAHGGADIENLPLEEKSKIKWDDSPDLRAEFGDSFPRYLAFEKADAKGGVKILSKGGK